MGVGRHLMTALGLSGHLADEPEGDYSTNVLPPSRSSGLDLPLGRALGLPAVFSSIDTISGMGSQLTLDAWRQTSGTMVDPRPALLRQPDPWRPLQSFLERGLVGLAVDGNAFMLKTRGADSQVLAVEFTNPQQTFIKWRKTERGWIKSYDVVTRSGTKTFAASEVEHIRYLEVPGLDRGLGPVQACRVALGGIVNVREYADGWFENPDVPTGVLSTDQRLDPAMARMYLDLWENPWKSRPEEEQEAAKRVGPRVRMTGQGLKYEPIMLNPSDAQWLEAQGFGVLDVARIFGLPAEYLLAAVEGNSLTYKTGEMIDGRFLRTRLQPRYLGKIAAALSACLVRGQEARFNTGVLLTPDALTQSQIDKAYIDAKVTTAEDVARARIAEGRIPAPVNQEEPTNVNA